jgi:phage-related protein
MVRILKGAFDLLLSVVSGAIRGLGLLGKVAMTLLVLPLEAVALVVAAVIDTIQYLVKVSGFVTTKLAQFFGLLQGKDASSTSFLDLIAMAIEKIASAIQTAGKMTEDFINDFIEDINNLIKTLNETPGINIAQVSKVNLTRDEASSADQADVDPKKSNQITYNEDNSTNIDQTVDADPEDKAQLSRVVSDAIAQANSFERRRQGGQ